MESLVLFVLPLSVLLALLLCGLMFVDVAFGAARRYSAADVRLAQEALGAVRGIGLAAVSREGSAAPLLETCRHPQPVPRVTLLEASAIVAELRQRCPAEVDRVRTRIRTAKHECPLLTETGMCACSMARPLSCLGKCVAGYDVEAGWAHGLGDAFSGALRTHLQAQHLDNEPHDLSQALSSLFEQSDARLTKASVQP